MATRAIVIGAGLSGLAAAGLLAKRGIKATVVEHTFKPGGCCGIFKREGAIFDQGSAMMYGFGEKGFNSHRFIFNCLEEPIDVVKHDALYDVVYRGQRIRFHADIDEYIGELDKVFPGQRDRFKRFYADMRDIYDKVIAGNPTYTTPDQTSPADGLRQVLKHPVSYMKFLSFLNLSTEKLLKRYFDDGEVLNYFNKLTSTYCYTDVSETPAILAAIMFVDNHVGGSYYPKGSTLFVPGKMEKSIEENGGDFIYGRTATRILMEGGRVKGVELDDGAVIEADYVIYSGTVWNLYGKLLKGYAAYEGRRKWAEGLRASYPSVILYALVRKDAIPEGTSPITLLASRGGLDEDEVTSYIFSIDDPSICPEGYHTVMAIGPTYKKWPAYKHAYGASDEYSRMKSEEEERLVERMEGQFPGFRAGIVHKELSTPLTIEKYTMKNGGAVAGPLQAMGQHMLRRLRIDPGIEGLYCCGESTTLGTGTPTVTVSGIAAANAVLRKEGLAQFKYREGMKDYVRVFKPEDPAPAGDNPQWGERRPEPARMASRCEFCEHPSCMAGIELDIRGINRRLAVGNLIGARKIAGMGRYEAEDLAKAEARCLLNAKGAPVRIKDIMDYVDGRKRM
ncbi:MAG TPA: FAD-dependent oxidoreductase [Bacillota bacterium]|nr:FAD-dependent oxidoreductase [Bacillota bacterium]HOG52646.1 FAD-dependent oxidoreductase [Bacillota bacterium]